MKNRSVRWPVGALVLAMGLVLVVSMAAEGLAGDAPPDGAGPALEVDAPPLTVVGQAALGAAPAGVESGIWSIAGSGVETPDCYQAGQAQTLCFTIHNGTPDGEWIREISLTFPAALGPWQASCNPALEDPTDSAGYSVDFACSTPHVNQILYQDLPGGVYGISPGASWNTCVDVDVPAGYFGPRLVVWDLTGSALPIPSQLHGDAEMEQCMPLMLRPDEVHIAGCNGTPQTLEFELRNYTSGHIDANLDYDVDGAAFGGPEGLAVGAGQLVTFTAVLEPRLCLQPGDVVQASLIAGGSGYTDTSLITEEILDSAGWHRREDSPIASMDSAVVWASHEDGGLWSISGHGAHGAAQRYDPTTDTWMSWTPNITPVIEYPVDACYGLNDQGQEIVVLFPDTIVTDTVQVFNIATHQWSTRPVPGFFPGDYEGDWAYDVVSLLDNPALKPGIPDDNVCYLSGGAGEPGGGRERNLWRYNPADNSGEYVGDFVAEVWFGFHASWYVPWIGDWGAICVAGGIRFDGAVTDITQCYDIAADHFHDPNVDLGPLPEPWWGMADGWQITEHGYELWLANGVAQNGTLLPASAYIREGMPHFVYGPPVRDPLYRLEGDSYQGRFFTLNGSRGGFWPSEFSLQLVPCPGCNKLYVPLLLRDG